MRFKVAALLLLATLSMPSHATQTVIYDDSDSLVTIGNKLLINAYKDKLLEKYAALQKCASLECLAGTKLDIEHIHREIRSLEEAN